MSYLRSRFLLKKFRTEGFEPEETTAPFQRVKCVNLLSTLFLNDRLRFMSQ